MDKPQLLIKTQEKGHSRELTYLKVLYEDYFRHVEPCRTRECSYIAIGPTAVTEYLNMELHSLGYVFLALIVATVSDL